MNTPRLWCLGNVVVDVIARVPDIPARGGDILASEGRVTAGGGFNVMAAAIRQGLPTVYGGLVGSGAFGRLARQSLHNEGIRVLNTAHPNQDTGFVCCLIDAQGERTFVTVAGAESCLQPHHLDTLHPEPSDLVYVSGYTLGYPSNRAALEAWLPGLHHETALIFDPGPLLANVPTSTLTRVMQWADWITTNAREAQQLTGESQVGNAALRLSERSGHGQVVVRDGAAGCIVVTETATKTVVPAIAVQATDTNGAGDTHVGTFLARLAAGDNPLQAARWANAAAALSVTRYGPATAPTYHELRDWLMNNPDFSRP